jgi:DNA-directed RNA polymerase specialized sigma24 family protein
MAIVILQALSLAQPATVPDVLDPTLVARAQRYEPEAVASLCDRNLDGLYRMCAALAGDPEVAESLAGDALMKALDGLAGFEGDGSAFHVWLLRLAAGAAARRRPRGDGTRGALGRLSNFDYELVALRVLAEVDVDHLGPALNAQSANLRAWLVSGLREADGRSGTGWGPDLRAFDAAVDDVIDGADPVHAATRASAPGDAEALLRVVAGIRGLIGDPIPPVIATRLRTRLLAAAGERRTRWVNRHHVAATVPGVERRRYPSRTGTFVALGFAVMLAIGVGAVLAVLSSFAGPTSSLYPLKRTGESVLLAVNVDPVGRADLEIKLAQTREREGEDMAARGDGDRATAALDSRYGLLRAASRDLLTASVHDGRWRAARDRLFKESDVPVTPIIRDLEVSGQARSAQDVQNLVAAYETDSRSTQGQLGRKQPRPPGQTPPLA